ncbi:hypothetical protein Nepgr_026938 [Nepenthes gracilis]|uniref:C3H1-type domain-containing protein n=1 Tax=Nepenthes gracilis TaxID=150966 RepID=A0AAD3Y2H6_NEPGR|nr:hypothetical protein Nepgr_026938 [Nepenthes gracilis]
MPISSSFAAIGKSSLPSTQGVSSTTYCSTKQGVPCIFFQKGYCLKGDRCPFLHVSILAINKVPQVPAAGATENYTQQKIVPTANVAMLVEALPEAKATAMSATTLSRDGACTKKYGPPSTASIDEPPNNEETIAAPINHEFPKCKSRLFHQASSLEDQSFQGNYDADDLLRESSPGFDVLVDDEIGDADYYHDGYQLVRMRTYDGRNLNELEIVDDYTVVADDDPETHHNSRGYDSDEHMQEQRWGSPDRSLGEAAHFDRRGSIEESDLRRHLLKQRRFNGLRSGSKDEKEEEDDDVTDFTGPKSLIELNVTKQYCKDQKMKHEQSYQQKWGYPMLDNSHLAEAKKTSSSSRFKENLASNSSRSAMFLEKQNKSRITLSSTPVQDANLLGLTNKEENKFVTADGVEAEASYSNYKIILTGDENSQANEVNISVNEGGLILDELENHEYELGEYDRRVGDYEFGQDDREIYNLEDGENAGAKYDHMDEDNEDDFAKKIGVMFP